MRTALLLATSVLALSLWNRAQFDFADSSMHAVRSRFAAVREARLRERLMFREALIVCGALATFGMMRFQRHARPLR